MVEKVSNVFNLVPSFEVEVLDDVMCCVCVRESVTCIFLFRRARRHVCVPDAQMGLWYILTVG